MIKSKVGWCRIRWGALLLWGLWLQPSAAAPLPQGYWLTPANLVWRRDVLPPDLKPLVFELYTLSATQQPQVLRQLKPLEVLPDPLVKRYPFVQGYLSLTPTVKIQPQEWERWVQGPLWLRYRHPGVENTTAGAALQTFGLLDQVLSYGGNDLGVSFNAQGQPTLKLWAPTARQVRLALFPAPATPNTQAQFWPMKRTAQGVWTIQGQPSWKNQFYLYEVQVYSPVYGRVETNLVTDPYSVSLADNSRRSQIIDLNTPALKPPGWDSLKKPPLAHPTDISLYELHIRDFSIQDARVPEAWRGRYQAFTVADSWGMSHLRQLAQSGLSHVHLLPTFDFATVEEYRSLQHPPTIPSRAADAKDQQAAISQYRLLDGFNWGYDPWHYTVPEGSYATEPNGSQRILEFRRMIQALNQSGLRVVMDVVYNHTHAAGQDAKAVLDRIVPGYYHRLDEQGQLLKTTCCPDTASEHKMMGKLMRDSLLTWAKQYKIDGFRFDLMGHHTRQNLQEIQQALRQLTPVRDGVDGRQIYLYGEGWRFGSLEARDPTAAMHQFNAAGTGVGTFNDRLRDSIRGGNYEHRTKSDQGFATGLLTDPNGLTSNVETPTDRKAQHQQLLAYTDTIRIGLAGNLQDFVLKTHTGKVLKGRNVPYRGQPGTGYAHRPQETINYVSAHDNYVLWDQITAKAPFNHPSRQPATTSPTEKAQWQQLALAMVALGQGIPFFHAGDEILRSKSGDGDSYDSGDWFNRLDYSYQTHNWGVGLPPQERNAQEWDFWQPRLADPSLRSSQGDRLQTLAQFHRYLQIRRQVPLLRLPTAAAIQASVRFLDTEAGPQQPPGLIVMAIEDPSGRYDPQHRAVLIGLNSNRSMVVFQHEHLKHRHWHIIPHLLKPVTLNVPTPPPYALDPVAQTLVMGTPEQGNLVIPPVASLSHATYDPVSGTLTLPATQAVVWVEHR